MIGCLDRGCAKVVRAFCFPAFLCFLATQVSAEEKSPSFHAPRDDLGTVQFEQMFWDNSRAGEYSTSSNPKCWWAYIGLPSFQIAHKNVFTAIELDGTDYEVRRNGDALNLYPLQRLGVFGGISFIDRPKHRGTFMVGGGASGEFDVLGTRAAYAHFIYEHRVFVSKELGIGLGILLMRNFGRWHEPQPVALLPWLQWRIRPRTRLSVTWDNVQFKQYIGRRFAAVAEARYDMSFFYLGDGTDISWVAWSVGGGLDVWLFRDYYVRIRYFENLVRQEYVYADGTLTKLESPRGRVVRLSLVYAK